MKSIRARRRPRQASRVALAVAALPFVALGGLVRWWRRDLFTVEVAGDSMAPALEAGDWLLVRRGPPPPGLEAWGRIVLARDPAGRLLLKRVVGLPGETVLIDAGTVHLDGRPLEEPYVRGETLTPPYRGLMRLDADSYYLLGDSRESSTDSRDYGPFARDRIAGVAFFRYWPPSRAGRLHPEPRRLGSGAAEAHRA